MIAPDVNIVIGALRPDARDHDDLRSWLQSAVVGPEPVALTDAVLSGVVRVLTHRRIFSPPSVLTDVLDAIEVLRSASAATRITPGRRFWPIFDGLCRSADARGSLVSDAAHAALAIEHGATWVTLDRGFARFPGLSWRSPY